MTCFTNKKQRQEIIKELYETSVNSKKLDDIFKSVKSKIKAGKFVIENCDYESCKTRMKKF